jgi:protein-disulfide isomerase
METSHRMWNRKYWVSVGLITIVLVGIAAILWNRAETSLKPTATPVSEFWRGAKAAPVTIDMYLDFTCEICVEKDQLALQALDLYPGKVNIVYHPYPFAEFGLRLAEALEAAAEQGKFWELHDLILSGTPNDISEVEAYAQQIGLDIDKFEKALDSDIVAEKVELAKQEAITAGITRVSLFVNGKEYEHSPGTIDDLRAMIDEELKRLGDQ